jgi:hypothetical protein
MVKYQANRKCKNCDSVNWFSIETGTTVEEYVDEEKILCRSCNCSLFKEKEEKAEEE